MSNLLKSLALKLPLSLQSELKRYRFARQIRTGTFVPDEPEIRAITRLVGPGDLVIDVGANVGHYTVHLSKQVGERGRVIAIEPMPETFALLTHNVFRLGNVSLLNVAIAEQSGMVAMDVPNAAGGGKNYYRARIDDSGSERVMCIRLDSLDLPKIRLIKIDAEGHDLGVLKSAERLIVRDQPALIVEASDESDVAGWMRARGYRIEHSPGSPNIIGAPIRA